MLIVVRRQAIVDGHLLNIRNPNFKRKEWLLVFDGCCANFEDNVRQKYRLHQEQGRSAKR